MVLCEENRQYSAGSKRVYQKSFEKDLKLTLEPWSIWIQLLLRQVVYRRHNHMDISLTPFFQILSSCSERWLRFFFDSEIDDNLIQKRMIWIYAELDTLIDYHCLLLISTWIFTFAFWSMIYTLSIILFWLNSRFQSNHCSALSLPKILDPFQPFIESLSFGLQSLKGFESKPNFPFRKTAMNF